MPAGAPGAADRSRDVRDSGPAGPSGGGGGDSRNDKDKKKKGILDPDAAIQEGTPKENGGSLEDDSGQVFAGETEEEAKARREAGGKSKRPEDIRAQQGGFQGSQTAGVNTEDDSKVSRGGLAI